MEEIKPSHAYFKKAKKTVYALMRSYHFTVQKQGVYHRFNLYKDASQEKKETSKPSMQIYLKELDSPKRGEEFQQQDSKSVLSLLDMKNYSILFNDISFTKIPCIDNWALYKVAEDWVVSGTISTGDRYHPFIYDCILRIDRVCLETQMVVTYQPEYKIFCVFKLDKKNSTVQTKLDDVNTRQIRKSELMEIQKDYLDHNTFMFQTLIF